MKNQSLKIATWNIKNSYFRFDKNNMKASAVAQILKYENLDVLALQEVNPMLAKKIEEKLSELNNGYRIHTAYQKTKNPIKNLRIEYNMIICRDSQSNLYTVDFTLYSMPKGMQALKFWEYRRRHLSITDYYDIKIDNTHLDHTLEELGKRQMKEVLDIVARQRSYGVDTVLLGNLNRKPTETNMIEFTKQLAKVGMQVVDNPHKTYIGHEEEQPVDYVIVPKSWDIESVQTLENYADISSHRPVVVKVRR